MTKTLEINCDKWGKIIGITLWVGATIGLGIGFVIGYEGTMNPLIVPPIPSIGLPTDQFEKQLKEWSDNTNMNQSMQLLFILSSIANIINLVIIWYVLNHHYKFLEIKCTA